MYIVQIYIYIYIFIQLELLTNGWTLELLDWEQHQFSIVSYYTIWMISDNPPTQRFGHFRIATPLDCNVKVRD